MNPEWLTLHHSVAAQRLTDAWRVPRAVAEAIGERLRESAWKDLKITQLQERIAWLESQVPPAPPEPVRQRLPCKSEWE